MPKRNSKYGHVRRGVGCLLSLGVMRKEREGARGPVTRERALVTRGLRCKSLWLLGLRELRQFPRTHEQMHLIGSAWSFGARACVRTGKLA